MPVFASGKVVPVALDTLIVNEQKDAEGDFFRQYTQMGSCGSMRVLTASGKLIGLADRVRGGKDIEKLLDDYKKQPEAERKPKVAALTNPDRKVPLNRLPKDALRIKLWSRGLERNDKGDLTSKLWKELWTKESYGDWWAKVEPGYDYLWLTPDEWKSLVPAEMKVGHRYALPKSLVKKITCDPLTHNAFSRNPPMVWKPKHLQTQEVKLTVSDVSPTRVQIRVEGAVRLEGPVRDAWGGWNPRTPKGEAIAKDTPLSFDGRMLGYLAYDRKAEKFTRFDIAALGDFIGFYSDANAKGVIRSLPLGVAFGIDPGPPVPPGLWHRDDAWWRD